MNELELRTLFDRKLKELKESDPARGRLLEGEILEWNSIISLDTDDSAWDALYTSIRAIARRRMVSEEQVINDLFDPESVHSFMMVTRFG